MTGGELHYDQLRSLIEQTPDAVIAIDATGVIIEWNSQAEAVFGWKKAEIVGRSLPVGLIPPKYHAALESSLKDNLGTGAGLVPHWRGELSALRRDGTEIPVELTVIPLERGGGFVSYAFLRDLTEEKKRIRQEVQAKRAEARAAEMRKAYGFVNAVIENVPDMIFVKEAKELRFVRFNKAGEELLGYSQAELTGKNDYDFFPKSEADFFTAKDREVLAGGRLVDIPEEPIQTRLRGKRILHTKKVPIYGESGQPEYLLGISADVTYIKQAEDTRRRLYQVQIAQEVAQKGIHLRDDFISIASHELKTPLTALKMQLQLIPLILASISFPEKENFYALFKNSLKQLDRFSRLMDELLDVSRISAGQFRLNKQCVILSEVISQALEHYRTDLRDAGCPITAKLDDSIRGYWDAIRVEQIVVNLLTNAMKYGAGKPIEIMTQLAADRAKLLVRDFGIGVAEENKKKIFERFERVAPVTKYRGLGLGLFITKQIVEAHGGEIRVESEIGEGSTFIVELPLDEPLP